MVRNRFTARIEIQSESSIGMIDTPLDKAHAHMQSIPDNDIARLGFFERFTDAELFVLLEKEATDDNITPRIFDTADGSFLLAFDTEERLSAFTETSTPYAALSGRAIASMLKDTDIGVGLNLDVAPSSILLSTASLNWLQKLLSNPANTGIATPKSFASPTLPQAVLKALDTKLASAEGLAVSAYLADAIFNDGKQTHLLAFIDAMEGAETTLANAAQEVLVFSGQENQVLDVAFFKSSDSATKQISKCGLRFDLPKPKLANPPSAPGLDPITPPKLR